MPFYPYVDHLYLGLPHSVQFSIKTLKLKENIFKIYLEDGDLIAITADRMKGLPTK